VHACNKLGHKNVLDLTYFELFSAHCHKLCVISHVRVRAQRPERFSLLTSLTKVAGSSLTNYTIHQALVS
jgi:hypothetical protein